MALITIATGHAADRGGLPEGWFISRCRSRHVEGEGTYYLVTARNAEGDELTAGETQLGLAVDHVLDLIRS